MSWRCWDETRRPSDAALPSRGVAKQQTAGKARVLACDSGVPGCAGVLFGSEAWLCADAATTAGLSLVAAQLHPARRTGAIPAAAMVVVHPGRCPSPLGSATAKRCSTVDDSLLVH